MLGVNPALAGHKTEISKVNDLVRPGKVRVKV